MDKHPIHPSDQDQKTRTILSLVLTGLIFIAVYWIFHPNILKDFLRGFLN